MDTVMEYMVMVTALVEAGHEVVAVVTQPDKPKGRSKELVFSPVKEEAVKLGIEVLQPEKARDEEFVEKLRAYGADTLIVQAKTRITQ